MTPMEIFQYAESHQLLPVLWDASYFNKLGFDHFEVEAKLRKTKNGVIARVEDIDEPYETNLSKEDLDGIRQNHSRYHLELMYLEGQFNRVQVTIGNPGEEKDQIDSRADDDLLLFFIELAGIDTVEKLEQVIQEGQDLIPPEIREDMERAKREALEAMEAEEE